jgi:ribA/ribD-fused uncharacterized protein
MERTTKEHTFFFRPESPFSQWYPARFVVDGITFANAEQFMMHGKAVLFGDEEAAARILDTPSPRAHKAIGRTVRGFVEETWRARREVIVYAGSRAKFTQNEDLRQALLATKRTLLVEASPYDRIWGVGLAADNPRIDDPRNWRGKNLLGRILTRLRDELAAEASR